MITNEKVRAAPVATLPVAGGDAHHAEEDGQEDEEGPGDPIHYGRGHRVGEAVIWHSIIAPYYQYNLLSGIVL